MSDHIGDANKMVPTPRTDAVMDHRVKLWDAINRYVSSCCGNPSRNVYGNTRRQQCVSEIESLVYSGLKRELAATNEQMSLQARQLLEVVNDRNRLGVQLDLIRDELQRIWARVMESGHADHPSLSWVKVYCERAQKDIAFNYTPIQERDKLSNELSAANAEIARLKAGGCARDQRTTQFCSEAIELSLRLEEANKRIAVLEREADEHAFSLSPVMVQARNDQLSQRIAELEQIARKYEDRYFEAQQMLTIANARIAELEQWIRGLNQAFPSEDGANLEIVMATESKMYVGPQKPEGLR